MKSHVENALYQCGPDRVMHREFGGSPAIAIRYDGPARVTSPEGTESYLVRKGETLDEAGEAAARAFAARIIEQAKGLTAWADRIVRALEAKP